MNTEDIEHEKFKCHKCRGNKFIKGQQSEITVDIYTRFDKKSKL